MKSHTPDQLAAITATPAALGKYMGKAFMGRPYTVHDWVMYMEQQILAMMYRPGNEVLVVSCPAQSGKTTYCGLLFPFWWLGRNPGDQVIFISYNESQASKWGLRVRNAMRVYGRDLFGVDINPDSNSAVDWKMGNGFGGMISAGIRGGLSGNPGNLIIADDVLKNAEEANSPAVNKRNLEEWDQSVMTRLQEDTKVLLIATRWTTADLSGEVIERSLAENYSGIPVNVLNIKALAEPDPDVANKMSEEELAAWRDPLGRKLGQGLKGQHSQRFYEMRKGSMAPGKWMAMYQGTPSLAIGGMFPESAWRYWNDGGGERVIGDADLPHLVQKVRVWDIASSEGAGDWTVGTLMGKDAENRVFVLGVERFRHAPAMVDQKVRACAESDGYDTTVLIEQERSGAGATVIDHYKQALPSYRVEGVKAEGDKESRATPYSITQSNNRVYLPRNASWVTEWVAEHNQMDGRGGRPKHDDQIDTGAYGVRHLLGGAASELWHPGMIAAHEGMTGEERVEMEAIRYALGFGR